MQQNNRFTIELNGIDILLVQEINLPDVETNTLSFGAEAGSPDIKIPGKKKVGQITLKKLRPSLGFDQSVRAWFQQTLQSNPAFFKRDLVFRELSPEGITLAVYLAEGCYAQKINHSGFKRSDDSELIMEEVTIECDDFNQLN